MGITVIVISTYKVRLYSIFRTVVARTARIFKLYTKAVTVFDELFGNFSSFKHKYDFNNLKKYRIKFFRIKDHNFRDNLEILLYFSKYQDSILKKIFMILPKNTQNSIKISMSENFGDFRAFRFSCNHCESV